MLYRLVYMLAMVAMKVTVAEGVDLEETGVMKEMEIRDN